MCRLPLIFLLAISLLFSTGLIADDKKPEKKEGEQTKVVAPQSAEQAKELFVKSFGLEKEHKYAEAIAGYEAVLAFYQKQEGAQYDVYIMYTLQNLAVLYANSNQTEKSIRLLQQAIRYAEKLGHCGKMSDFHHKLGVIYNHKCQVLEKAAAQKNDITPDGKITVGAADVLGNKNFTDFQAVAGAEFVPQSVETAGTENPFSKKIEHYTKFLIAKVRSDFDEDELITPDSVRVVLQIEKKGYYPLNKMVQMLPEKRHSEVDEMLVSMPRKIEPKVFEDFFMQGPITPDEITLTNLKNGKENGKPRRVSDDSFKPGHYLLSIRKAGYEDIKKALTIYPNEGPFQFEERLLSKMREIAASIRGDFVDPKTGKDTIAPDTFTLNGQTVKDSSKVKPGEYQLVIKEEGFEPIIKTIIIPPSESQYRFFEQMKTLNRQVYFQITGDYQPDKELTPDEIAFNNRFVKITGESLRPDTYRVVIRKRGYEPVSKRVTIYPSSKDYILKESLRSLPRRVQTQILASFPKMRISPDKCTLNGRDIKTQENFKPGKYELKIERAGYTPVTKSIEIPPSDEPYTISSVLDPKDVELKLQITYDVEPENKDQTYKCDMKNEAIGLKQTVTDGKKIKPESYLYEIIQPGYEIASDRVLIMPREDAYVLQRRLVARDRTVVTDISDEAGNPIEPDEITLDGKAINKGFKVKPGIHELVILKEGYIPVRKQVQILASDKDYILAEVVISKTRLVTFEFRDSYTKDLIKPEQISIGKENPKNPKTVLTMKPGNYPLRVVKTGYAMINKTVNIPVGSGNYVIKELMNATVREVHINITGDFKPAEPLEVDLLTMNEMPMGAVNKIRPGMYELVIERKGYYPIYKRLNITPGQEPYKIDEQMKSKPRKVNLNIVSSYTSNKMTPTSVLVGTTAIKDGQEMKPSEYQLAIKEKGYKTISSGIVIEPSEDPYVLEATMEALPRKIQYSFVSDFDNKEVMPDVITLDNEIMEQGESHLPGTYTIAVEKQGYNEKSFEIVVTPSDEPYLIKDMLETVAREIELDITGDFPVGERIDPEIVALDGKDAREHLFKPRKYELEIQQPGYIPLRKNVTIEPGNEPYLIQEVLATKPRKVDLNITYDIQPPSHLAPYKITMAPLDKPTEEKEIKPGDIIKPNSYILKIVKPAYETIEVKQHVWPDDRPYVIDQQLRAKQVPININITHNVEPPSNLPAYQVSLISKKTKVLFLVTEGKRIRPGSYDLKVTQPGYSFGAIKTIDIAPSEDAYLINESLLAKNRQISFEMVDEKTRSLVDAHEVIDLKTKKKVEFRDEFEPGKKVNFRVKFKKYQTVSTTTMIPPGEGPYILPVPLVELQPLEFTIRKNTEKIDGIEYQYNFSVDGKELEDHHIKMEKGIGRFYYTVMVPPKAKNFRAYIGYMFLQRALARFRSGMSISRPENLSVPKLIEHLDRMAKGERGRRASLEVMEKLLKGYRNRKMLKQLHNTERDQLISYLESWKLGPAQDRVRLQVVVEAINKNK